MKNENQKLLSCSTKKNSCTLNCEINLDRLFETKKEREKFNAKWKDFIASDPDNPKVYHEWHELHEGKTNLLKYKSEQLIPKEEERIPYITRPWQSSNTLC